MPANPPSEFWTDERCFITELLNRDEYPEVSIARTRVEPGTTTQLHALSVHEFYVIESGTGLMHVGSSEPTPVRPGCVISILRQESQKIENSGDVDLVFLCVCAPRFEPGCYTSLE